MLKNKNIKQNSHNISDINIFFERRFLYIRIMQRFGSADKKKLQETITAKKEAGETEKLDVSGLVNKSNEIFDGFQAKIATLPFKFQTDARRYMLNYFINSADRFDKDQEEGLDKFEFAKYKESMLRKMTQIMSRFMPSKELIAARKAEMASIEQMQRGLGSVSEKLKKLRKEGVTLSTANLTDPIRIKDEMLKLSVMNEKVQSAGKPIFTAIASVFGSYQGYLAARRKGKILTGNHLHPDYDVSPTYIKSKIKEIKSDAHMRKLRIIQAKTKIHGEKLQLAGQELRKRLISNREHKVAMLEKLEYDKAEKGEKMKMKNEKIYNAMKQRKELLLERRKELASDSGELIKLHHRHSTAAKMRSRVEEFQPGKKIEYSVMMPRKLLKSAQLKTNKAVETLQNILDTAKLSPQQRKLLEKKLKVIGKHRDDAEYGLKNLESYEKSVKGKRIKRMELIKKAKIEGVVMIDEYLNKNVNPTLNAMDDSVRFFEIEQLKNGTEKERKQADYAVELDAVDNLNEAVTDNLLQMNLGSSLMVNNLERSLGSLSKISVKRDSWFRRNVTSSFDSISEGIKEYTSNFSEKTLGKIVSGPLYFLSKITKDIPVLGRITKELYELPGGIVAGAGELAAGLTTIVGRPIETIKGLGALTGFDPNTGKWSLSTFGKSWGNLFKAIFAVEEFKKGKVGKGIGKAAVNVLTTVTGVAAIGAGSKAAKAAYLAARAAGKGKFVSVLKATGKFFTGGAKGAGTSLKNTGIKIKNFGKALISKKTYFKIGGKLVAAVVVLSKGKTYLKAGKAVWRVTANGTKAILHAPGNIMSATGRTLVAITKLGRKKLAKGVGYVRGARLERKLTKKSTELGRASKKVELAPVKNYDKLGFTKGDEILIYNKQKKQYEDGWVIEGVNKDNPKHVWIRNKKTGDVSTRPKYLIVDWNKKGPFRKRIPEDALKVRKIDSDFNKLGLKQGDALTVNIPGESKIGWQFNKVQGKDKVVIINSRTGVEIVVQKKDILRWNKKAITSRGREEVAVAGRIKGRPITVRPKPPKEKVITGLDKKSKKHYDEVFENNFRIDDEVWIYNPKSKKHERGWYIERAIKGDVIRLINKRTKAKMFAEKSSVAIWNKGKPISKRAAGIIEVKKAPLSRKAKGVIDVKGKAKPGPKPPKEKVIVQPQTLRQYFDKYIAKLKTVNVDYIVDGIRATLESKIVGKPFKKNGVMHIRVSHPKHGQRTISLQELISNNKSKVIMKRAKAKGLVKPKAVEGIILPKKKLRTDKQYFDHYITQLKTVTAQFIVGKDRIFFENCTVVGKPYFKNKIYHVKVKHPKHGIREISLAKLKIFNHAKINLMKAKAKGIVRKAVPKRSIKPVDMIMEKLKIKDRALAKNPDYIGFRQKLGREINRVGSDQISKYMAVRNVLAANPGMAKKLLKIKGLPADELRIISEFVKERRAAVTEVAKVKKVNRSAGTQVKKVDRAAGTQVK